MKNKILFYIFSIFLTLNLAAQNNSLIIDGAFIVLDGGSATRNIVIVIDQNNTNGIIRTPSGGFIHSESQYNYVKWNAGNNTGSYVFPFGIRTNAADYIPFIFNKSTNNTSDVSLSTWFTDPLNIPKPSTTNVGPVTNMFGTADSVVLAIDRFWDIQTATITTADITFSYRGVENTTTNPTNNFLAQHWNGTSWDPQVGPGNPGVTTGIGTVGPVLGQNTFSPWVLTTCVESINNQNISICQGDSVLLGGNYQNISGTYNDTISGGNTFGCDSIIVTNLTVNPVPTTPQTFAICQGDSILLGGNYQNTAGTYYDTLQTSLSCDSIVTTTLVVSPVPTTNQNLSICAGDSILLGGNYQNTAGTYNDTLQTVLGCDSIITTVLTINPVPTTNQNFSICQGDSILLGGSYQSSAGTYNDTLQTVFGCDSILQNILIINPTQTINQSATICQGDSILLGGSYQTNAGSYNDTLQNINGCDSILITSLMVNPKPSSPIISGNDSICKGDSLFLTATGSGTGIINWYSDNQGNNIIVTGNSLTIGQLLGGTYVYYFNETLNGCSSNIDSIIVYVREVIAQTSPSPTSGTSPLNVQFFNNSVNANSYFWDFGTGDTSIVFEPNHTYNIEGSYDVMLIATDGICYDTIIVTINVLGTSTLIIPTIFTPNGDNNNDIFTVKSENIIAITGKIFNRWGQLLYEWDNINGGWNGRTDAGVEVPDGTYFFIIEAEGSDNKKYLEKGTLTLIR